MNAVLTAISPITVTDVDGIILSYTIVNIPPDFYGKLYYNNAGSYDSVLSGSLLITPAQAATLKFKPSGIYSGNITVKFTALDNMGANSNIATLVIPVLNADPLAIDISNSPIPSAGGPSFINALSATDEMEVKTFIIKELPAASSGTLVLDGSPVSINQEIPVLYANRLEFDPNPAFSGTASFKYTAMDAFGKIDWTFATVTIPVTNTLPEAIENSSQVITNKTGTGLQLLPALTGYDADGTIASYTIKTLPTGGKLYLNGAAINTLPGSGLSITPLQASQLYFDPNDNFNSTASFTFTVTDNNGNTDATPALYNMYSNVPPVTNDVNSVSMFQGQSNSPIQSLSGSDDVTLVFYSILTLPAADQGTLYLNNIALTSTSQVDTLSPAQASQLSFAPSATFKGAIFTYTATDNLEIIDVTPAVYRIPFGTIVLPVELISFTGTKSGTDKQLNWTTDQEINSDRFELERSNDGITFKKISTVNAKGNTTYKTDYAYTDKNVSGTKLYYRLKMVDIDGKSDYSRIVVIKRDKIGLDINSVTPNPFIGKLSVEITSEINGPAQLQLFDLSGKMVRSFEVKTVKGTNLYNLDKLESLNSGIYILSIRSSDGVANIKLYKGN